MNVSGPSGSAFSGLSKKDRLLAKPEGADWVGVGVGVGEEIEVVVAAFQRDPPLGVAVVTV